MSIAPIGGASASAPYSAAAKPSLTVARFSDIYKSAVASAIDSNEDTSISEKEYLDQILAAGGNAEQARARYGALEKDSRGGVAIETYARTVIDPLGSDSARKIEQILEQIKAGQGIGEVRGSILDGAGKVRDPDQMLRYLANKFPGNINA